ncbi:MAG: hypothetical protein CVT62_06360 [Actinobacteria bacterium HGW-Actinobacteria-2]|nr:MAG: hypothetical protein CVT62_06360 [Actinobacteria bacterium HGW-Actinobacteria-2]
MPPVRTSRSAPPRRLRSLKTVLIGLASVLAVGTAVSVPTVAHADVTVPQADIFDVDFRNGSPIDHAAGRTYKTYGTPKLTANGSLNHVVASFDGTGSAYFYDMASAWNSANTPNLTAAATVECWFRYDGSALPTSEQEACSGIQTGGIGIQVNYISKKPVIRSAFYIGGGYRYLSTPLELNTWYHVVATYDGAATKLYLNGALVTESAITGPITPPGGRYFVIGADTGSSAPEKWSPSSVAVSRLWSTALSADQVAALYAADTAAPVAVPAADVLDVDLAGGSFTDQATGATPDPYADPKIDIDAALGRKAASFDGVGQAVVYPIPNAWDAAQTPNVVNTFSIECDFRFNGPVPTPSELDVCSGKNSGGFSVYASGDKIGSMAHIGGGYRSVLSSSLATGVWHTVVATYDGAVYKLYVDGQVADAMAITGVLTPPVDDAKYFVIGGDTKVGGYPEFLAPSTVAGARIWSTALTADQVAALNYTVSGARQVDISLKSSVPAAGATISEPVTFSTKITNQGSATGWAYTLDGNPISIGQEIGAGLTAGTHTIGVTATDAFGHPISWTVPFTSGNIPVAGGTDTTQAKGSVTLSAIAQGAAKGDVTTTFTEATPNLPTGGFSGTVAAIPSTLDFSYSDGVNFTSEQLAAGEKVASPSSHNLMPFQRFDVGVGSADADRMIRWSGQVDPQRTADLYVWNAASAAWVKLAGAAGQADADIVLSGKAPADAVDNGTVHVLVVALDPFADDLSSHDSSAGTPTEKDHFEKDSDYDFSFVHWTDPQYVTEGATGGSGKWPASPTYTTSSGVQSADEQAVWATAYQKALQWTADNAASKKIAYTANTGDIINNDLVNPDLTNTDGSLTYPGLNDQVDKENAFAAKEFKRLEGSGVVNQTIAGNHDNQVGAETGPTSRFSKAFSAASYYGQAKNWPAGASYHAWDETTDADGKTTTEGSDNQNNYVLFSAGGLDFVAVGLSYGVTKAEADWANSVFSRYPDRNGILITHSYLAAATAAKPDGRNVATTGDGSRLYQQVAAANPNVFLVLAGHIHGVGTNLKTYQTNTTQITHHTVEMLADYQNYQLPASKIFTHDTCPSCVIGADGSVDTNGDGTVDHKASDMLFFGAAYQRVLQFNVKNSTMSVDTYSPFFDAFGNTLNDPAARYNGAEDNFTVPVDLTSRKTSFATTGLSVFSPTATVIGSATVKSGFPASVAWTGLEAGKTYAWTATTKNADGTVVGSVNQFGGVFTASAQGTDTVAPVIDLPANTTVDQNTTFDALDKVKATDNTDGDVSASIQVAGSVNTATPGSYTLIYTAADANGNQAQAVRTVTVRALTVPDKQSTKVSAKDVTVVFGTSPELTGTVGPTDATGTVQFNSGEDELCRGTIVNGTATCTVSALPPTGTYPVTVDYSGDSTHLPSHTAIALKVTEPAVSRADTTTTGANLTITEGTPATLAVNVTGGATTPTGTVDVTEGSALLGRPGLVDGAGRLTFTGNGLSLGSHTLTLTYSGDTLHKPSQSTVTVTVVKAVSPAKTSVKISVKKTKSKLGVTVKVGPSAAKGTVRITIGTKSYRLSVKNGSVLKTVVRPKSSSVLIKVSFTPSDPATYAGSTATLRASLR